MDIATGLMLTALALFEDAETPLGHVSAFDAPSFAEATEGKPQPAEQGQLEIGPFGQEIDESRQLMVDSIRSVFEHFEQAEMARPGQREQLYENMRKMAQQQLRGI